MLLWVLRSFLVLFSMNLSCEGQARTHSIGPLRLMLSQIAYIGTDYPVAVSQGQVLDQYEYTEIIGFFNEASGIFLTVRHEISSEQIAHIENELKKLGLLINNKADQQHVSDIAQNLARSIALAFKVPMSPSDHPVLAQGHHVYHHYCAGCHGSTGKGDGPAGTHLAPPPKSFSDQAVMEHSSPFKFFNITMTGVKGTGMGSYRDLLSQGDLWSVSYYLSALRFHDASQPLDERDIHSGWQELRGITLSDLVEAGLNKGFLASVGDQELLQWLHKSLKDSRPPEAELEKLIALLRCSAPFLKSVPLGEKDASPASAGALAEDKVKSALRYTLAGVEQAREAGEEGRFDDAESLLSDAYLHGFHSAERAIGLKKRQLVSDIERLFLDARGFARKRLPEKFTQTEEQLRQLLEEAFRLYRVTGLSPESSRSDFLASLVIIVREGLEAFLIVAALLALLAGTGARGAVWWVHAGWSSALAAGFLSFILFEKILGISGAAREGIEAICTAIAAILLFYTGFWLLSQSEHYKWQQFVREKTRLALNSGKRWGLFSVSFIAVYREAAETVLFYSALYSSSSHPIAIGLGFLTGCFLLLLLCWAMIRFNLRLPMRHFFLGTSCFMVLISIVLTGKAVHEITEAGFLDPTPLNWVPLVDTLGIYPSVETILAQALLLTGGMFLALMITRAKCGGKSLKKI